MGGVTTLPPISSRAVAVFAMLACAAILPATSASAQSRELKLEEFRIEGEVQRPQASFFLPRSGKVDLGVDVRSLKPRMTAQWSDLPEQRPEFFRTDRR
jgi:hypothetical protein